MVVKATRDRRRSTLPLFEDVVVRLRHWSRAYSFEINRHRWELAPHHHDERDTVLIQGELEKPLRRRIGCAELRLMPSHVERSAFSEDVDRIGNVWVQEGVLCCSAWIPADAYFSLMPPLAADRFSQVALRLQSLRYNRGTLDMIKLLPLIGEGSAAEPRG